MTRPLTRRVLLASAAGVASVAMLVPGTPSVASPTTPTPTPSVASPTTPTPTPAPTATEDAEPPEDAEPAEVPRDPLRVVIERLTPSALPARGDVEVRGTVTNTSKEDWVDLGVYLFTSYEPMTTTDELRTAVASDPRTDVGDRIVEPGLFSEAPDLAPGESAPFRLSVPVDQLVISGEPGVYWVGVHVLGTSSVGRLEGADGRARTFLPLVPERNPGTRLALGMQFRNHIVRAPDGQLEYLDGWQDTLSEGGRLHRLLELAETAPTDQSISWVLDAAVIDAAISVRRGNPTLELVPTEDEEETDDGGSAGDPDAGSDTGTDTGEDSPEEPGAVPEEPTTPEEAAAAWVDGFFAEAEDHSLLALPYGDLDVSSVMRHGMSDLLTSALGSATQVLTDRGLTSTPLWLPPSGLLAPVAFSELDPGLPVVLAPAALPGAESGPVVNRADGGRVLLAPGPDQMWGPAPGAPRSALAVRQRLLADVAVHALSGEREDTIVRFLPPGWDPGKRWQRARFFAGLDVPWVTSVDVADLLSELSPDPAIDPAEDLVYPETALAAELPLVTVLATEALIAEGATVEELITEEGDVDEQVVRQALLTSSVWSRWRPGLAAERAVAARDRVAGWLDEVTVRGPSFVTMSSETGTFQVTVVNGLDLRVTVGLRATVPGGELLLTTPEPIELAPNSRGAMRIDATATDIGVHLVTLQPVSTKGTPLGEPTQVSIRSSRVGLILWIVMAIGGTALFVAIALRIWRRVRRRRRTHGPVLDRVRT